jgi:hypothetical protein
LTSKIRDAPVGAVPTAAMTAVITAARGNSSLAWPVPVVSVPGIVNVSRWYVWAYVGRSPVSSVGARFFMPHPRLAEYYDPVLVRCRGDSKRHVNSVDTGSNHVGNHGLTTRDGVDFHLNIERVEVVGDRDGRE